jgi:hypothetical protein
MLTWLKDDGWFKLSLIGVALLAVTAARSNYTAPQPGTAQTVVAFDTGHGGTSACAAANTQCPATALIDSAGTEKLTGTNPGYVGVASDSSTTSAGTTAVAGTTATSVVGKASAGNLQSAYVTSSAAGWVFLINATSLPGNATLTIGTASGNLQGCFELQKGVTDWGASITYNPGPWEHFSTGIVVAVSSTDCPVLTAASTGKFIHAQVN